MQNEAANLSDLLEKVALFALQEGAEKLGQGADLVPFTVLVQGEDMYIETHPGETVEECFESARGQIKEKRNDISCYALCYDGYVEVNKSEVDAIVVEFAEKGDPEGHAACRLYGMEGDELEIEETPSYLGECPSLFVG